MVTETSKYPEFRDILYYRHCRTEKPILWGPESNPIDLREKSPLTSDVDTG